MNTDSTTDTDHRDLSILDHSTDRARADLPEVSQLIDSQQSLTVVPVVTLASHRETETRCPAPLMAYGFAFWGQRRQLNPICRRPGQTGRAAK
jgi:hypothetical protein